jgi:hypothetical protein
LGWFTLFYAILTSRATHLEIPRRGFLVEGNLSHPFLVHQTIEASFGVEEGTLENYAFLAARRMYSFERVLFQNLHMYAV